MHHIPVHNLGSPTPASNTERHVGRAPAKAFHGPLRIRGSGAGRDTPDLSFCVLRSQHQKVDPAAQIDRYEPLAGVSTWSRTAPDIEIGRASCRESVSTPVA